MEHGKPARVLAGTNIQQDFVFKNLSRFRARLAYNPPRFEDRNSFGNGTYKIDKRWEGRFELFSDNSRRLAASLRTNFDQEALGGWSQTYNAGLTWRMSNRMTSELVLRYRSRNAWLLHTGDDTFARFRATEWAPRFTFDYFPTARQQFRIALQWVAIDARERDFFRIPTSAGALLDRTKLANEPSDDFTVSRPESAGTLPLGDRSRCQICFSSIPGRAPLLAHPGLTSTTCSATRSTSHFWNNSY